MKKHIGLIMFVISILVLTPFFLNAERSEAFDAEDILKDIGASILGGMVIDNVAPQFNELINTITFNKGAEVQETTKVVPIVSGGKGFRIGMAQIAGPEYAVNRTKAVAQLETKLGSDKARAKILIPLDSKNPLERFRRVQEVAVTAIIDYRI